MTVDTDSLKILNEELKKQALEVPELFAHQVGPVWQLTLTSVVKAIEETIGRLENAS